MLLYGLIKKISKGKYCEEIAVLAQVNFSFRKLNQLQET